MKILFVISNLRKCGPVFVLYNLVCGLVKLNNVDIIITTLSSESSNSMYYDFEKLGVNMKTISDINRHDYFKYISKVKQLVDEIQPTLIHSFCFRSTVIVSKISYNNTVTTVHNYFESDFIFRYGKMVGKIMCLIYLKALKKTGKIVCVSNSLKQHLSDKYDLRNIEYVYNSVDTYTSKISNSNLYYKINIIMVDELSVLKNNDLAISCFTEVYGNNNNVCLKVYGSGEIREYLINKYKHIKNINFMGFVSDKSEIFCNAHYYLSASLSESFHLSFVEALVSNSHCIVSDISVHKEIADLYPARCTLFDVEDKAQLIDILKSIKDKKITGNNAVNHFTHDKLLKEYYNLYSLFAQ